MFNSHLRNPCPKVTAVAKSWNRNGRQRSGRKRGKEKHILSGDKGRLGECPPKNSGSQSRHAKNDTVRDVGEATGEIELKLTAHAASLYFGSEGLESQQRLSSGSAETAAIEGSC